MSYYADSSFLVSCYLPDANTLSLNRMRTEVYGKSNEVANDTYAPIHST
jgi:hypothetical protein